MKRKYIVAAFTAILLIAVFFGFARLHTGKTAKKAEIAQKGVYYDACSLTEAKASAYEREGECHLVRYTSLLYQGKLYTSCAETQIDITGEAEAFDKMLPVLQLEYIADVYSNGSENFWADDKKELPQAVTKSKRVKPEKGKVYRMKAYEKNRLVLCYTKEGMEELLDKGENILFVDIYEQLNDIRLEQGEELYQDIFHLNQVQNVYARKKDTEEETESPEKSKKYVIQPYFDEKAKGSVKVDCSEKVFAAFYRAVCKGKFISQKDAGDDLAQTENREEDDENFTYYFLFKDSVGIETTMYISPNGYAVYESPEQTLFIIKVEKALCAQVIEKYFS